MAAERTPPPGFEELRTSAFLERVGPLFVDTGSDGRTYGAFVDDHHLNTMGGAHGGFLAALVDVATARATRTLVGLHRSVRTVSTTIDYVAAAAHGDWLRVDVTIDHTGRRTAFTSCRVLGPGDVLVARATVVLSVAA